MTAARVRFWHDEDGWGVVDSDETPGGCWAHYSAVAMAGYRRLWAGQDVELEWEPAQQDGYAYRACRVWPRGREPHDPPSPSMSSTAYRSTLSLTFDPPSTDAGDPT